MRKYGILFSPKFMHNIRCSLKTNFNLEDTIRARAQLGASMLVGKCEQVARK